MDDNFDLEERFPDDASYCGTSGTYQYLTVDC